jgi:adenylate cyclase class 2
VEVKIRLLDNEVGKLTRVLHNLGAERINEELHEDTYYEHPCKSYSRTDEAIRVRRYRSTPRGHPTESGRPREVELTYKGPKIDSSTKTRIESSVYVNSSEDLDLILQSLGFKPVATIRKKRVFYSLRNTTLSIDNVDGLGRFMELEIIVDRNDDIESAREHIFSLVRDLGLSLDRSVRESYLELYLSRQGL